MNSDQNLRFDDQARVKIADGIDLLANAVKVTLGPKGRNAVIDVPGYGTPRMTKDGVTVARSVVAHDRWMNIGVRIGKGAAEKQNIDAGDGTTTVMVLTQAIVRGGIKAIAAGMNPMDIKRGIDIAADYIKDRISAMAQQCDEHEDIYNIALISANGDSEIARHIADGMKAVGKSGIITAEESPSGQTELEIVDGLMLDKGFAHPAFVNRANYSCDLENPLILIYNGKLAKTSEVAPFLESAIEEGRAVLIIAEGFEDEIMAVLTINKLQGGFRVCAVRMPRYGLIHDDILEDMAVLTGSPVVTPRGNFTMEDMSVAVCGSAKRVIVKRDSCVIVEGAGDAEKIKERCALLQDEIATASGDNKKNLEVRLAQLGGGIAVVKVGGATEVEIKERKDRVDDAIHATRAAVRTGIVPGGGTALAVAGLMSKAGRSMWAQGNRDQEVGIDIMLDAAQEPLRQIARNAGKDGGVVLGEVMRESRNGESAIIGYNARTDEYHDLLANGVIDPAGVIQSAVTNAASIGGLLLTTEVMISQEKDDDDDR